MNILSMCNSRWSYYLEAVVDLSVSLVPICKVGRLEWMILGLAWGSNSL